MKIEIDIPDWVEEKHLYLFAGIELVAYKYLNEDWKIKTSRCNMCGKCCENLKNDTAYPPVINNKCIHLINDGNKKTCGLAINRPFRCGMPQIQIKDGCSEKFN